MNTKANNCHQGFDFEAPSHITLYRLPSIVQCLEPVVDQAASLPDPQAGELISSAIAATCACEQRSIAESVAHAQVRADVAAAAVNGLKEQLHATPSRLSGGDPTPRLPRGFRLAMFVGCLFFALLVTVGDGFNATFLAARELQSWLAGAAFLLPALAAPIVAKAAIGRLPQRPRFWAEVVLGVFGLLAAGIFLYQFVHVFAGSQTIDQLVGGSRTGMSALYLCTLLLGFCVVYVLLTAADGLLRTGMVESDNPKHTELTAQLARAETEFATAEAALRVVRESVASRRAELDDLGRYLGNFAKAAVAAKRSLAQALADERAAAAKARAEGAAQQWQAFQNLIVASGANNGVNGNGSSTHPITPLVLPPSRA